MRRIVIRAAVIGGVVLAARALAPKLHARMLATCKGMFEHMPEDFPPKRMMGGIEETSANTTRILELLEERSQADAAQAAGRASMDYGGGRGDGARLRKHRLAARGGTEKEANK
jgi:hypothetical protein